MKTAAVEYHGAAVAFLHVGDTVTTLRSASVTGAFFDVVGAHPVLGLLLRPDDDRNIVPTPMVISEHLWRTMFGASPTAVGRVMKLGVLPVQIVGVADAGLDYPRASDVWTSYRSRFHTDAALPGFHDVIGRLAAGRTPHDAQEELGAFLTRPDEPHSGARLLAGGFLQPVARPIRDAIVGDVRPAIVIVGVAVGLLLLVICLNVANLLLVRMLARRREFAVRAALGAGRARIALYVLMECALLSAAGGALGVLCAWYAVHLFAAGAPSAVPRAHTLDLDGRLLAASVGLCVLITLAFGSIPAFISGGTSLAGELQARRQGQTAANGRLRNALITLQVAMAVSLLVASIAVARGFDALAHRDLGFDAHHLIIGRVAQNAAVGDMMTWKVVVANAIDRVRVVPSVVSATGLTEQPFSDAGNDLAYGLPGDTPGAATNRPLAAFLGADPDYFRTLGIALEEGRTFTANDRVGTPPVAVVDELLAKQAWPGREAIGQEIGVGMLRYTVIGVVAATRYRNLLAPRATLYTEYVQTPKEAAEYIQPPFYVAVRSTMEPARLIPQLARAVRESDPRLFLADPVTLGDRIDAALAVQRLGTTLLIAFSASVMLLTALGLYSVAATFVRDREFEIGVRIALGATPMRVRTLVIRQAVPLIACGVIVGILGAVYAGVRLADVVTTARPRDPLAIVGAVVTVCIVTAAAFGIPARRAARANPADVLRRG